MNLASEIQAATKNIKTDNYPISIGEIINMYKDGDIIVFPEYQRYFRWSIEQKSLLIESLLLGIPIPPIFVSQGENNKWDIIDGLQRTCTILEFVGVLKYSDGSYYKPSTLVATKFLPSLEGKAWDNEDDPDNSFDESLRRLIKRRKLNFNIIDSNINPTAKYELFQRLNTTGSSLTPQEVRNCVVAMTNMKVYHTIAEMASYPAFVSTTSLSEKQLNEQFDKELVLRYLIIKNCDLMNAPSNADIHSYLSDCLFNILERIEKQEINLTEEAEEFKAIFTLLDAALTDNAFKKYYPEKGYERGFNLAVYESVIPGMIKYYDSLSKEFIIKKFPEISSSDEFTAATEKGIRPIVRFKSLSKFSLEFFKNED